MGSDAQNTRSREKDIEEPRCETEVGQLRGCIRVASEAKRANTSRIHAERPDLAPLHVHADAYPGRMAPANSKTVAGPAWRLIGPLPALTGAQNST